jgi:hypothetical protein
MLSCSCLAAGRKAAPLDLRTNEGSVGCEESEGAKLGNPRNIATAGNRGRRMQVAAADEFVAGLLPLVRAIQNTGANKLEAITCALNERGVRPARGTSWYVSSVANLLSRAQKLAAIREQAAALREFYRREISYRRSAAVTSARGAFIIPRSYGPRSCRDWRAPTVERALCVSTGELSGPPCSVHKIASLLRPPLLNKSDLRVSSRAHRQ